MNAQTIIGCFEHDLPRLVRNKDVKYKSVAPSSKSTKDAQVPYVLLCQPSAGLMQSAQCALDRAVAQQNDLKEKAISSWDLSMALDNETEHVNASMLYMMGPINEILRTLFPTQSTMRAEANFKSDDPSGECFTIRIDLIYENTETKQTIVVVEYKRREQIRYLDFEPGLLSSDASPIMIEEQKYRTASNDRSATLAKNALSYMKQATKYAADSQCRHVALFNWDHLLILEFHKLSESKGNDAGDEARLTWITEKPGETGEHAHRGHIRKALLGFIIDAFEEHFNHKV
ncbi:hypothetical protein N0V95_008546 [Ascochyta clinopodiicola]|nr:hypothetical protein N0V95_008546 [Ascochyta clinopodiicola]